MSTDKYGTPQRIDSCFYRMLTDHDIRTKAIALLSFVVNISLKTKNKHATHHVREYDADNYRYVYIRYISYIYILTV